MFRILAINPGSTSTKIALYEGKELIKSENLSHSREELKKYNKIIDQLDFRYEAIEKWLEENSFTSFHAIVGRGGLLRPMESGTYEVNDEMIKDLKIGVQGEHASNLGGLIAKKIADRFGVKAYIVDPVAVDEFEDIARISGMPEIPRRSLLHALNVKAVAHRVAKDLGKSLEEMNLIVAHLGGGISIVPIKKNKMVDVNNANEMGPFSPERTGGLPVGDLVKLAFSGKYDLATLKKKLTGEGGLVAYLNTNDAREVERRIKEGDKYAELIYNAMAYQIAKEIGAMATVLKGQVEKIVLTGGLSHSKYLTDKISEYISFIGEVLIYPGEDEMIALVEGVLRVLNNEEKAKIY
ncbi:butyrate kinase [Anaerobranca californiensis DSM 14826]|jgi:butyrate kinase|uniref:Probable butyrate kinase n=1 Tax=Anaerobranca californiensis DSM 14826 TaxID=1120989 RepID=A0A1M6L577_9FIRM|nr:butyrate kinase [Anaerobranca californiensis]SHJ66343.1 butyrate kinase [Anaerobranca californiensis DSM 14826]